MRIRRWLSGLILLLLVSGPAWAVTNVPTFAPTPKAYKAQITNASGVVTLVATTNFVTVATGATNGTRINALYCTSSDSTVAGHNIAVGIVRSATLYPLGVIAIAQSTVTSTTQANVLTQLNANLTLPIDSDRNPFIHLESTDQLVVGVLTTAVQNTPGMAISCMSNGADF